jgi:hypothetical protein
VVRRIFACLAVIVVVVVALYPVKALAAECADYLVVGARGSNEVAESPTVGMGPSVFRFASTMRDQIVASGATVDLEAVHYPAVAPWGNGQSKIPNGSPKDTEGTAYPGSVDQGVAGLLSVMRVAAAACPDTRLILGGYSQGADVIGYAIEALEQPHPGGERLDQIAGVALFGDPRFNPKDSGASDGDYDPSRSGLFGPRDAWSKHLRVPVISVCREGDFFCQMRVFQQKPTGTRGETAEAAVVDPLPIMTWAAAHWGWNPLFWFDGANNDKLFSEHNNYLANNQPAKAASDLASRMGISTQQATPKREPIDVAIIVDSTSAASAYVSELQSRASEFVHLVTDNAPGVRVAVIDFKSAATGAPDPYRVHVSGFSSDPQVSIDALDAIEPGGGPYGAIYSAVDAMNNLSWRKGAKKVSLALIASRACGQQICSTQEGSGVSVPDPLALSQLRRAGVYTLDNWYFFESPGWAAALGGDTAFTSRPGGNVTPDHAIDELKRVLTTALVEPWDGIKGTSKTTVGNPGYFSAASLIPYYENSNSRILTWSSHWAGPLPTDGGGPTASRAAGDNSAADTSEDCGPDPACPPDETPSDPPADEGPYYSPSFNQPGLWDVELTAYLDGETVTRSTQVRVEPIPATAPASPLLTSFLDNGEQVLAWSSGDGEPAASYDIVDAQGQLVDTVIPVSELGRNGRMDFEYAVPLGDGEEATYTVRAVNAAGTTAATDVITASRGSFGTTTGQDGSAIENTLSLRGPSTPDLQALSATAGAAGVLGATGNYSAELVSPSGTRESVDMSEVPATLHVTPSGWSTALAFGDSLDADGHPVSGELGQGLADELLAGGHIDLRIGSTALRIQIAPNARSAQLSDYLTDPQGTAPVGVPIVTVSADSVNDDFTLDYSGNADPTELPFLSEAAGSNDWSGSTISDIHTWVGSQEVSNTLTAHVVAASRADESNPSQLSLRLNGAVAGGDNATMRTFLTGGVLSFRLDDGPVNALSLQVPEDEASAAYPPPTVPPSFIGAQTVHFVQYTEGKTFKPVIDWGSDAPGSVDMSGELPAGLWYDWGSRSIEGTPTQQGSFPISFTAISDSGQVVRDYTIVVSQNHVGPPLQLQQTSAYLNENGTLTLQFSGDGYYRPDNPDILPWLPVSTELASQGSWFTGQVDNLTFTKPDGTAVAVAGTFFVTMWSGGWGKDSCSIYSEDATVGTNSAAEVNDLLSPGTSLSFTYDGGPTNVVRLAPNASPASW